MRQVWIQKLKPNQAAGQYDYQVSMNERNCKNWIGKNWWISWTGEQELFLSQFPLDNPTARLANDVCVCQKYRKNMEFYPGTVFSLFLVKMNLASNQATGKFLLRAWLASVTFASLCYAGRHFGLVLRQLPSRGKLLFFSWSIWKLWRLCNSCVLTHYRGYSIVNVCRKGESFRADFLLNCFYAVLRK